MRTCFRARARNSCLTLLTSQGYSVLGSRSLECGSSLLWSAVACHFGVRELAPALHWGAACRPFCFIRGLAPLLTKTAASRLTESGGKPPHSKIGERNDPDNGSESLAPSLRTLNADSRRRGTSSIFMR